MSFGGARVPDDCVVRTFRVKVMTTAAKQARARAMLVAGGDAWAWTIDRFHERREKDSPLQTRTAASGRIYEHTEASAS
jgi:hypothetical protein